MLNKGANRANSFHHRQPMSPLSYSLLLSLVLLVPEPAMLLLAAAGVVFVVGWAWQLVRVRVPLKSVHRMRRFAHTPAVSST